MFAEEDRACVDDGIEHPLGIPAGKDQVFGGVQVGERDRFLQGRGDEEGSMLLQSCANDLGPFTPFHLLGEFLSHRFRLFRGGGNEDGTRVGRVLGGGGRYDQLMGRFGKDTAAVGFSLSLEALLEVIEPDALGGTAPPARETRVSAQALAAGFSDALEARAQDRPTTVRYE